MQSNSLLNLRGEFRSFNNQIDTKCMQLVSIWSNVLQRDKLKSIYSSFDVNIFKRKILSLN